MGDGDGVQEGVREINDGRKRRRVRDAKVQYAVEFSSPLLTAGIAHGLRYPSGPPPLELFIVSLPRETNDE